MEQELRKQGFLVITGMTLTTAFPMEPSTNQNVLSVNYVKPLPQDYLLDSSIFLVFTTSLNLNWMFVLFQLLFPFYSCLFPFLSSLPCFPSSPLFPPSPFLSFLSFLSLQAMPFAYDWAARIYFHFFHSLSSLPPSLPPSPFPLLLLPPSFSVFLLSTFKILCCCFPPSLLSPLFFFSLPRPCL